ncbi:MAG: hypothetical protein M3Q37_08035 [Gemmatimonadota bacterium]|nr:hypothetical protein [Gemmatimonadota bacterium]
MNPRLAGVRQELLEMAEEDLRVRAELAADGSLFEGYHPRMRGVHDKHATRLARIMAEHGWPVEPLVGVEGARAAWLIVQHAIAQPAIQRRAFGVLSAAARRREVPAWQAATLEDRIRIYEGRPQRYGTQFDWDPAGELNPLPIEDPAGLDGRRKAVGLRPMQDEIQNQRDTAAEAGEHAPADWEGRRREMDMWLREVGWRS